MTALRSTLNAAELFLDLRYLIYTRMYNLCARRFNPSRRRVVTLGLCIVKMCCPQPPGDIGGEQL